MVEVVEPDWLQRSMMNLSPNLNIPYLHDKEDPEEINGHPDLPDHGPNPVFGDATARGRQGRQGAPQETEGNYQGLGKGEGLTYTLLCFPCRYLYFKWVSSFKGVKLCVGVWLRNINKLGPFFV